MNFKKLYKVYEDKILYCSCLFSYPLSKTPAVLFTPMSWCPFGDNAPGFLPSYCGVLLLYFMKRAVSPNQHEHFKIKARAVVQTFNATLALFGTPSYF
jgi:hypothetical protein